MKSLRSIFWRTLLSSRVLRLKLAFQLKHNYAEDLDIRIPLGEGLHSPVFDAEISASFYEIFLQQEYRPVLEVMPLPKRWIDLGSYAGFFSLWMEWQCRRGGAPGKEVLLVDANDKMSHWIERVIAINELGGVWRHECAAIATGDGQCDYVQRAYMGSSLGGIDDAPGDKVVVPVINDAKMLQKFSPPYDLIKVDIEGAEFEFLQNYPGVLSQTRHLCIEWHSWHAGGGGVEQIRHMAEQRGFRHICEVQPARTIPNGAQTGVLLFLNTKLL